MTCTETERNANAAGSTPTIDDDHRFRAGLALGLALVGAALVPLLAVVVLVGSVLVGRPALSRFVPGHSTVTAVRVTLGWAIGFGVVAVGQGVGAEVGIMSIFDAVGLAAHTVLALFGEVVLAVAMVVYLRRSRARLSASGV